MKPEHACPRCGTASTKHARRCSNPECRTELGLCSHCKALVALTAASGGGIRRAALACPRCGESVVRCRTSQLGGSCNGLARANGRFAHQFCDDCGAKGFEIAKQVGVIVLASAVGGLLRRGRR